MTAEGSGEAWRTANEAYFLVDHGGQGACSSVSNAKYLNLLCRGLRSAGWNDVVLTGTVPGSELRSPYLPQSPNRCLYTRLARMQSAMG